jgi:CBS-domain-containing membrane protein
MKAKDAMSSPAVTVSPETPLKEAGDLLARHQISALPVVDTDVGLVGIVSQLDLIRFDTMADNSPPGDRPPGPTQVADVMTTDVVTVNAETDLHSVAQRLLESHIRQLPVLSEAKVVGVVSRRDLVKWMARSDAALTLDVSGVLRDQAQHLSRIEVTVRQGVAHIEGVAPADTLAFAARVARSVPGITDARVSKDDTPG